MKELLNKHCKIQVLRNGKNLFYEAQIIDVDKITITFIDKYKTIYCYRKEDIVQAKSI